MPRAKGESAMFGEASIAVVSLTEESRVGAIATRRMSNP